MRRHRSQWLLLVFVSRTMLFAHMMSTGNRISNGELPHTEGLRTHTESTQPMLIGWLVMDLWDVVELSTEFVVRTNALLVARHAYGLWFINVLHTESGN